jgi:hypothetical protein
MPEFENLIFEEGRVVLLEPRSDGSVRRRAFTTDHIPLIEAILAHLKPAKKKRRSKEQKAADEAATVIFVDAIHARTAEQRELSDARILNRKNVAQADRLEKTDD